MGREVHDGEGGGARRRLLGLEELFEQDGEEEVDHEEAADADDEQVVEPREAEDVAHQHVHALRVRVEGGALHDHQARSADVVKIHRPVEPVVGEVLALRALRNRGARIRGPVDAAKLPAVL